MPDDLGSPSRRDFLQTSTAGAAAQALRAGPNAGVAFHPAASPRKLSDNLFVFEDTCNVYAIRTGTSAVLIDFGSGAILDHLAEMGIQSVEWILHTHHHRDQAQGAERALARHIPIAVPVHERHLFESVEDFWRNRRIFELYYVRNDFFSLTRNVPVAAVLRDYEIFRAGKQEFLVQPTPGHTPGSITLVSQIDGRNVAFSGDLMHSSGKVLTLYDLQYYYGEHEGADLAAYSLSELAKLNPQLLCPSHGDPLADPRAAMQQVIGRLGDWYRFWNSYGFSLDNRSRQLTPHVVAHHQTMSSFYAIISDSGKALFLDYGGPSWNSFYSFKEAVAVRDRFRFIEHSIDNLRANHGLKSVDVAIPSHMHDDHLNGFPHLAKRYRTKIWVFENFADILANPAGHNLGCTLGEPIRADRILHDRETFRWEEFEFTAVHSPGHTNFQMALFSTIDGVKIAFTGDAFFHDADRPFQIRHNLIYRNRVKVGDHLKSVKNLLEFEPQIIAPGHGEPFLLDLDMAREFAAKLEKQDALCRALVADPVTDIGLDPSWVELYPYQSIARAGETRDFEIRARNHRAEAVQLAIRLVLPEGWEAVPAVSELLLAPHSTGSALARVTIPTGFRPAYSRMAIAADVRANGRYLGQIAEAVIDFGSAGLPPAARTAAGF